MKRSPGKKIALCFVWGFFALILLEALLQLGAIIVKENSLRAKTHWLTGHVRVLALGDSNTYGLYLPAEDSYPAQLEGLWNEQHPEFPIEVINLGYPGTNTFRLLANLPELLDTFKPDLVLLMIGFNDFWTPEETPAQHEPLSLLQQIKNHSRLYKLFYMATRDQHPQDLLDLGKRKLGGTSNLELTEAELSYLTELLGVPPLHKLEDLNEKQIRQNPELVKKLEDGLKQITAEREQHPTTDILNTVHYGDKTFSLGIADGTSARHSKQMESNLKAMLALLNERNISYFLLDYPTRFGYYPSANKKIVHVAEETGAPFIDLQDVFHSDCQRQPAACPELLFYDAHATAKGNQLIAEKVMADLAHFYLSEK